MYNSGENNNNNNKKTEAKYKFHILKWIPETDF